MTVTRTSDLREATLAKIIVVEDDFALGTMVQTWLENSQHSVELVERGDEAISRLKTYLYDLIVLDWNLPGKSGVDICRDFRNGGGQTPILLLTSKGSVDNKVEGLHSGADDYLTKPFDMKELSARVIALLRRSSVFKPNRIEIGQIVLDSLEHHVFVDGKEVQLLPKEYALLELFLKHPNQLLSSEFILEKIWTSESDTTAATVRAHMYNLRKKLQKVENPSIATVHGAGYRLEAKS